MKEKAHRDRNYPAVPFFISEKQIYLLEDIVNDCIQLEMSKDFKNRNRPRVIDLIQMNQRLIAAPILQ